MAGRFVQNRRLVADLRRQQTAEQRKALMTIAEPARERADQFARQAHAPWMPKAARKDGQQAVVTEVNGRRVSIVLRGYGAHLIEFGSKNNPAWAPLRRGVRAAGLGLSETGREPTT